MKGKSLRIFLPVVLIAFVIASISFWSKFGADPIECWKQGGSYNFLHSKYFFDTPCRITYSDYGKACTDGSECLGGCIPDNSLSYVEKKYYLEDKNAPPLKGICRADNYMQIGYRIEKGKLIPEPVIL